MSYNKQEEIGDGKGKVRLTWNLIKSRLLLTPLPTYQSTLSLHWNFSAEGQHPKNYRQPQFHQIDFDIRALYKFLSAMLSGNRSTKELINQSIN